MQHVKNQYYNGSNQARPIENIGTFKKQLKLNNTQTIIAFNGNAIKSISWLHAIYIIQ